MKRLLFIAAFLSPGLARAETWSASLLLPQGPGVVMQQAIPESRWALEVGLGGWPFERAWPGSLEMSSDFGEAYSMDLSPRAYLLATQVAVVFRSSSESTWRYRAGLDFWTLSGGAQAYLRNEATGERMLVGELETRWWQPWLQVGVSKRIGERWQVDLSVALRLGGSLRTELAGPLPALLRVAPEYRDAIVDGSSGAEADLSSALREAMSALPVMPSLGVRYDF